MANKFLFASKGAQRTDTVNNAGGKAYRLNDRQALAQLAATGCLNQTYYVNAETQLDELIRTARKVEPDFLAKTAIYTRKNGYMKDTPALLTAMLATESPVHLPQAFGRTIDNGKMLRNFVQIMRSGATGRKSLGSRPKRLVQTWLNEASDRALLQASIGQSPSLADVIKMVHPKPISKEREAFFAWIVGKPCDFALLPKAVKEYVAFKENASGPIPDVPFQMLTALPLTAKHWAKIAERGGWHMLRMNLNTFHRHGVFELSGTARKLAARLADREEIGRARVFPYQLLAAWKNADPKLPPEIREALQDAMEFAVQNVPALHGDVVVCPDVSGSMTMPVTGYRPGASSKVSCVDVAGLIAAAVLRKNPRAEVLPFDTAVRRVKLNPRDAVVTNAQKLAMHGGGTACSAPLAELNRMKARPDLVILVSDNESWADRHYGRGTGVMNEWMTLKRRNPDAKLVCLDIAPSATTPAHERPDVLNVGGFSDNVFEVIAAFAKGQLGPNHWVGEIEKVKL